jgi:sporulation protein YlmC with PRC-barrel domain
MILAASLVAVPALAASPSGAAGPTPAMTAPATNSAPNMSAGMAGNHPGQMTPAPGATSMSSSASLYTTTDGQVRIGKVVGASVYNDQNQSLGSVDDVLMSSDNKATAAVISVGGFLGMGEKLVSVPFDHLKIGKDRIVMPGATKASLKDMPPYKFNNA